MFHRFSGSVLAIAASCALAGAAGAADLGGDCCADLEERIAELEATTARKGNRKVSLTVYGEINQAVMWWDDGAESNFYVVTNSTTSNRIGFEGRAAITPDWSAGYRLELEIRAAESDFVDQGGVLRGFVGVGDEGLTGVVVRHSNWYIESKTLGRVTIGQGSDAADGIAEIDLSGSSVVAGSAVETWNEGFALRNKNSGATVGIYGGFPYMVNLFRGNLDGGRGNFVRYDSPVLAGFILSASWGEVELPTGVSEDDHDWSVALRYAGEFGGFQFAAGISYREGVTLDSDNFQLIDPAKTVVGSLSVLHVASGLFFTGAAGDMDLDGAFGGSSYYYVKSGIYQRWLPLGKTSVYGEYYHTDLDRFEGQPVFDETANMWGIGVVQHIDAAAMELYLSYRHYWADDVLDVLFLDRNDIQFDAVMSGARIKF